MKCPRCQSPLPTPVRLNAEGFLVCTACGSKLRPRTPPVAAPEAPPAAAAEEPASTEDPLASLTEPAPPESAAAPPPAGETAEAPPPAPVATTPQPVAPRPPARPSAHAAGGEPGPVEILAELRAIRRAQDRILELLLASGGGRPALPGGLPALSPVGPGARPAPTGPGVRTQNRKTVLLIDDDLAARTELAAALAEAEVPVREAGSGNEGLTLISQERPDVIVIEAELGGDMSSQDTITLIKATMEWIDIPIVLYTRLPIADQEEARTSYAADDFVAKGPGAAAAIVARVVGLFRR